MAQASLPLGPIEAEAVYIVDQFGNQLQDNLDGVVLISAVLATGNQTSGAIQQNSARGIKLFLHVTTIGVGGALVVILEDIDPVSGLAIAVFTLGTPVASNGITAYTVYPGLVAGTTTANDVLTKTYQARVTGLAAGGSSFTLSGSYLT